MKERGKMKYYWHVHHKILVEGSVNIKERIEYIKNNKPAKEIEVRLSLLKEVKGQLPKAYAEAEKTLIEAEKARHEAGKAYQDACKACDEAEMACQDAYKACQDEIEALHDAGCPDCPWDGKTIFPKGEEK